MKKGFICSLVLLVLCSISGNALAVFLSCGNNCSSACCAAKPSPDQERHGADASDSCCNSDSEPCRLEAFHSTELSWITPVSRQTEAQAKTADRRSFSDFLPDPETGHPNRWKWRVIPREGPAPIFLQTLSLLI